MQTRGLFGLTPRYKGAVEALRPRPQINEGACTQAGREQRGLVRQVVHSLGDLDQLMAFPPCRAEGGQPSTSFPTNPKRLRRWDTHAALSCPQERRTSCPGAVGVALLPHHRVAAVPRQVADRTAVGEGVANRLEETAMAEAVTAQAVTDQAAMDRAVTAQAAMDLEATLGQITWESARVEEKVRRKEADGHRGVIPRRATGLVATTTNITSPQGVEVVDLLRRIP